MPYVITTNARTHVCSNPDHDHITRRAVATLEEARKYVQPRSGRDWRGTCEAITEQGGTVTHPDGTVIEVEPVDHQRLVDELPEIVRTALWLRHAAIIPTDDLCVTFNDVHERHARAR